MLGDATGIGPEISVKVLSSKAIAGSARLAVVGDARVLELGMRDAGITIPYHTCTRLEDEPWPCSSLPVIDLANLDPSRLRRGERAQSFRTRGGSVRAHRARVVAVGRRRALSSLARYGR